MRSKRMRWLAELVVLAYLAAAPVARAQVGRADTADVPKRVEVGAGSGVLTLGDGRTASGVISLMLWRPASWLTASFAPTVEHLSGLGSRGAARTVGATGGLADLPVGLSAQREWNDAAWQPSLVMSLGGLLPTGDATRGLGGGYGTASLSVGAGVNPIDAIGLSASTTREITHDPGTSARPVALQADVSATIGDLGGLDVGWSRDVAALADAAPYVSFSAGASVQLGHGLVAAADWSRSVIGTGAGRQVLQGVSLGIGMAVPSFVPSNGDPAEARGRSGATGRARALHGKAKGKGKGSTPSG